MSTAPVPISTLDRLGLPWLAAGAGIALLLVRSMAATRAGGTMLLLALYLSLLWVSADGIRNLTGHRLRRWSALAIGVAAVGVAAVLRGPVPAAPRTAWALPLAALAAVAEEAYFRGVLYRVAARFGAPVAVVGTAAAFALVHVPAYGVAAIPVDLGAGLLLSWQRWASGGWGVPAATHAVANVLAVWP